MSTTQNNDVLARRINERIGHVIEFDPFSSLSNLESETYFHEESGVYGARFSRPVTVNAGGVFGDKTENVVAAILVPSGVTERVAKRRVAEALFELGVKDTPKSVSFRDKDASYLVVSDDLAALVGGYYFYSTGKRSTTLNAAASVYGADHSHHESTSSSAKTKVTEEGLSKTMSNLAYSTLFGRKN